MAGTLDLYCERTGPDLLAEPLNAVTNLAFLLAAYGTWRLARRARVPGATLLAVLLALIGLGSAAFHTVATRWAMWMDVAPIAFFQLSFVALYLRNVLRWRLATAAGGVAAYVMLLALGGAAGNALNGSVGYLPALLVLLVLGIAHRGHAPRRPNDLLLAAGVFTVSLGLRTIDLAACAAFPPGTHFLWHVLNGTLLFIVARAYVDAAGEPQPARPVEYTT